MDRLVAPWTERNPVNNAASGSAAPAGSPPPPHRVGPGGLLTLVNGVLAGVGSVYATTRSLPITLIAGITAVVLAALIIFKR